MIVNVYISDTDTRLIENLRSISGQERRSLSFIIREALEFYLSQKSGKTIKTRRLKSKCKNVS
jgi:hypothetical protein